jgi:hypothetical protein
MHMAWINRTSSQSCSASEAFTLNNAEFLSCRAVVPYGGMMCAVEVSEAEMKSYIFREFRQEYSRNRERKKSILIHSTFQLLITSS